MRKTKEQKGITLIALIITIIVLLILAVVAIGAVQNDGIINHAKNAREEYGKAGVNENTIIEEYFSKIEQNAPGPFSDIDAKDYGASIEYSVDLNNDGNKTNDWKVFYKDDQYLYIIASDYILNTNLPTGFKMSGRGGQYGVYCATVEEDFISTSAKDINQDKVRKYKLSWLSEYSASTYGNARATADFLNVDVWTEKFGNEEKGIEAIGSPTLEMWVASWNAKGYTPVYTKYVKIGYSTGITTEIVDGDKADLKESEGFSDTLYFPHGNDEGWAKDNVCNGYWLASPGYTNAGGNTMMYVHYQGNLNSYYIRVAPATVLAMRPLVSIPKNLITLDENGNLKVAE